MPIRANREYRAASVMAPAENNEYIVEGYASTFKPYVLYSYEGVDYWEKIDRHAFDEADIRDCIMQYDHEGRVYARQSNGTLEISIDDHGLKIRADLSKTEGSRELYEEIKAGLIKEMSFAFTISEDAYDRDTHTRTILKIKKVYDVSAVSIPANPDTDISARSYFEGVIEAEKQELLEREKEAREIESRKAKIRILIECEKEF